jgi:hypothetical protein
MPGNYFFQKPNKSLGFLGTWNGKFTLEEKRGHCVNILIAPVFLLFTHDHRITLVR